MAHSDINMLSFCQFEHVTPIDFIRYLQGFLTIDGLCTCSLVLVEKDGPYLTWTKFLARKPLYL